jgi:hypothetical protein
MWLSESILSWAFVFFLPPLLPLFLISPFWLTVLYQEFNPPLPWRFLASDSLFLCLQPYPSWELEGPLGSWQVSISG